MTLSPIARLQLMPLSFEANLAISDVFAATVALIEEAEERDLLVKTLTGYDPVDHPRQRRTLALMAASVALQTRIEDETLRVFVADSGRFYRVPFRAFIHRSEGVMDADAAPTFLARRTIEASLSEGVLYRSEAAEEFHDLARERRPLVTTEEDSHSLSVWLQSVVEPTTSPSILDYDERLCSWFTRKQLERVLQLISKEGGEPKDYTIAARIVHEFQPHVTKGKAKRRAVDVVRKAVGARRPLIDEYWRELAR